MAIPPNIRSRGKNKERASTNGSGGAAGIILNMDMVSTNDYAVAYTVPVQVGSSQQNLSLQVDTGSSDLWIASKSCSSSSCSATNGHLYDPGSSQTSGFSTTLVYLSGTASGPIVWDQVQLGGYVIPNQALAAAAAVSDEPLSYNFDGILGLALPSNSLIQQLIPTSANGAPDGATLSSNLFSAANAPAQPFFSLTLARPGFSQIPSLLGIGRHPPEIVPDPSRIKYSSLSSDSPLYWKTTVRAITVYVNGQAHPVALQSLSGAPEPTALVDSGLPVIMTTPLLADGIYGALGINPASDGQYYVPCATPLNMTITLDGQPELALHPLDLTAEPPGQSNAQYCTGLIQADPTQLIATSDVGDMVLGVPFLRSVYAVLAYQRPDASGTIDTHVQLGVDPTLGLLGLTNATQALAEFHQVRVLQEPPGSAPSSSGPKGASAARTGQLSIGVKILIGLVGFFALCIALFGLRCLVGRRRRRAPENGAATAGYHQTRSSADQNTLVDALPRKISHDDEVEDDWDAYGSEFGLRKEADLTDPWDPYSGTWRDTIIGTEAGKEASLCSAPHDPPPDFTDVDADVAAEHASFEESPERDLDVALLTGHDRNTSTTTEFGAFSTGGMAGIGTVARGSVIDPDLRYRPSVDSDSTLWPTAVSWRTSHVPRDSDGILFEEP